MGAVPDPGAKGRKTDHEVDGRFIAGEVPAQEGNIVGAGAQSVSRVPPHCCLRTLPCIPRPRHKLEGGKGVVAVEPAFVFHPVAVVGQGV